MFKFFYFFIKFEYFSKVKYINLCVVFEKEISL